MKTVTVTLHDSSKIDAEVSGSGPVVLLPASTVTLEGKAAEEWLGR